MEKHPVLADLKSDRIEKMHLQCYKLWGLQIPKLKTAELQIRPN